MTTEMKVDSAHKAERVVSPAKIMDTASKFKRWGRKYPFLRYGLPLISLTVFGSVGLAHLIQGRQELDSHFIVLFAIISMLIAPTVYFLFLLGIAFLGIFYQFKVCCLCLSFFVFPQMKRRNFSLFN